MDVITCMLLLLTCLATPLSVIDDMSANAPSQRLRFLTVPCVQVAGFPRGGPPPLLPGGGGFRPFFGGPPPPHGHRMGPPPPHGPPNHAPPIRHNTTHLHPQHRRMLTQRMQSRGG